MGIAKAKQSAGQKALDLTKQANRLGDLDMPALLRCDREKLKELGVPVQERKRLLRFLEKYRQGYRHDGRPGKMAWKGWVPPYRLPGAPGAQRGRAPYRPLCTQSAERASGEAASGGFGSVESAAEISTTKLYRDCMRLTYHIAAHSAKGEAMRQMVRWPPAVRAMACSTAVRAAPTLRSPPPLAGALELQGPDARRGPQGDLAPQDACGRGAAELCDP